MRKKAAKKTGRTPHPRGELSRRLRERSGAGADTVGKAGAGQPEAVASISWGSDEAVRFGDALLDEVCFAMGVAPPLVVASKVTLSEFIPGSFGLMHFQGIRPKILAAVGTRLTSHFGFPITEDDLGKPLPELLLHLQTMRSRGVVGGERVVTGEGAEASGGGEAGPELAGSSPQGEKSTQVERGSGDIRLKAKKVKATKSREHREVFDVLGLLLGVTSVATADGRSLRASIIDYLLMFEGQRRHMVNYLRMSASAAAGGRWLDSYYRNTFEGRPAEARAHAASGAKMARANIADCERCIREAYPEDGGGTNAWPLTVSFTKGPPEVAASMDGLVKLLEGRLGEPFVVKDEWPEEPGSNGEEDGK